MNGPRCWLPVLLAGVLVPAFAQADPPSAAFRQGTHVLRRILYDLDIRPLERPQELFAEPEGALLVVLGDPGWSRILDLDGPWLHDFVKNGGAVLYASDSECPQNITKDLLKLTNVHITGFLVKKQTKEACYKVPECPFLEPNGVELSRVLFRNPHGVKPLQVAANLPSFLLASKVPLPGGIQTVALLPKDCLIDDPKGGFGWDQSYRRLGVAGDSGKGRILVLADHSLFINEMMMPADTGNVEFATNCLEWLRERPDGRHRRQALFVEEGKVNSSFNVPLKEFIPDFSDKVLEAIKIALANLSRELPRFDTKLAEMEDQNTFNRHLWSQMEDPERPGAWRPRLLQGLVLGTTLALLLFLCYRISGAGRNRLEPGLPALDRAVQQHHPAASALEQRFESMLEDGNLTEAARSVARQILAVAGVEPAPAGTVPPLPILTIRVGWWRRWHLAGLVRRLWHLAFAARPLRVSLAGWKRLLHQADEVNTALQQGELVVSRD